MIKVKYNVDTGAILGYFPDSINYKNNSIDSNEKTIDGSPYVEIEKSAQILGKTATVIDGIYKEYVKSTDELLIKAKEIKKAKINNQRNTITSSLTDFTKDDKKYFFDRSILSRQTMAMAAIALGGNDTIDWITEDNSIVTLTNQEVLTICSHIMLTDAREVKLARLRKNAVLSLTSLEEVENYDITQVYID